MARSLSWLVVAGLAGAALVGPGAAGVAAGGPGADNLPNSGHTSSNGLTLVMGTGTMDCTGDSVNGLSGSFTYSGGAAGDHVVVYLTPNTGSDASPVGNVEDNEATITLTGASGTVNFSIDITSAFTTSKGGVLIVFAAAEDGTLYHSKSNSLNCTETTTSSTSSTTTESSTTTTTESSTTSESSTETSTTDSSTTETSSTVSGTESSASSTSSESSGGEVLGVEGTPKAADLPATSTLDTAATTGSPDALRFILLGLAVLIASILLLQPKGASSRK
jgi:hypothetical protein